MRTTLTLDPDVAAELERRRRDGRKLKPEVNRLLRLGLRHDGDDEPARKQGPYTTPSDVGAMLFPVDNVAEALAHAEGESYK